MAIVVVKNCLAFSFIVEKLITVSDKSMGKKRKPT